MTYIDVEKLKNKIILYYDKVLNQDISDDQKLAKHDMISDIMIEINEQPTVDVKEDKYGEWIPIGSYMTSAVFVASGQRYKYSVPSYPWKCSECGKESDIQTTFCPKCGAKMEVE